MMKYKKILITLISLTIFTLLIFITYNKFINSSLEFNKYVEENNSNLFFFTKKINGNKIIYSHKGKMNNYIGTINLIRDKSNNSHISDEFKINIGKILDKELENNITLFIKSCKEYVDCEDCEVNINIETSEEEKLEDSSQIDMLENNMKINYVFQDKQKLYIINIKKENQDVIGTFSYNGEIPKVKAPGELTKEEIEKSFENITINQNNDEFGVG